tara:strand:+ start:104 stop:589 length:486 start_codon:yes stop_codon:yes gene_type:complete
MYTFEHNPTFDLATFTRLFDDCKAKILEGTIDDNTTEAEAKSFCAKTISNGGATIVCKKDNYVVAMIGGIKKGKGADFTTWVLGRDLSGSKSWLYDPNWVSALTAAMKEKYIQVESAHRDGHSADNYSVAMYEQATGLWGASSDKIVRGQGPTHRSQEFKD